MNKKYFKSGQIGIIAVLLGVVIFTLGMATAARVTTDIKLSSRTEEGARAAAAAEAAMEIANSQSVYDLGNNPSLNPAWHDDAQFAFANYSVTPIPVRPAAPAEYRYEMGPIDDGETKTVWLVDLTASANSDPFDANATPYPNNEDFEIHWSPTNAKVEISLYYQSTNTVIDPTYEPVSVKRWFITSGGLFHVNNVPTDPSSIPSDFNQYYLVRIKAVNGSVVDSYILPDQSGVDFPPQGFTIIADGWTANNQVRRRVSGTRNVGEIPLFFDYVLANGGGALIKLP